MLDRDKELHEIWQLTHKHHDYRYRHFDWENNLLKRTTSNFLWRNVNMVGFLNRLEKTTALIVEQNNLIRNFFNTSVDKYYNDHWG